MFNFTKKEIEDIANKVKFNRNMTEKVLRLMDVLNFINENPIGRFLVLKGGTAIKYLIQKYYFVHIILKI